jgi:tRNA threonylcarbamoyladenosine biosynthesis protein TsaE
MLFTSNSVSDTYQLAKRFTQNISKGNIIALIGDLGTGKTTFTQGVAEALGIKENVGSPTFKLVSEYKAEDSWLYHIDAYRLKGSNDFLNIGGEEYLNTESGITIIEWADIISDLLDDSVIHIHFSRLKNNSDSRQIKISGIQFNV